MLGLQPNYILYLIYVNGIIDSVLILKENYSLTFHILKHKFGIVLVKHNLSKVYNLGGAEPRVLSNLSFMKLFKMTYFSVRKRDRTCNSIH